jgi:hypothetical protein
VTDEDILTSIAPISPTARLIWTAIVDVADRQHLGEGPLGDRYMVPIEGGRFYAGRGFDGLSGVVLPGGADRQLIRPDGIKELDALYEMRTDAGETLTIRNNVIVDEARQPVRYAMSVISVSAPNGALEWLNRRLILGTLQSARPKRQAVVVRAWLMDAV